jgi:subtilase family serine protease
MTKLGYFTAPLLAAASMASISWAAPPVNAQVAAVNPSAPVDFEVFLPLRNETGLQSLLKAQQTAGSPSYHRWLTPAQFKAEFGPTEASFSKVSAALTTAGLQVTANHTRSLHVIGTAAQVGKALGTSLNAVTRASGPTQLVAATPIKMPSALQEESAVIAAFGGRPPMHVNSKKVAPVDPNNRYSLVGPYWFDDLKQAYNYPSYQSTTPHGKRLDGTGVTVAILMETNAQNSDLANFFNHENFTAITGSPPPTFATYNVDGGAPFNPSSGGSLEASLDVQQVLGGAPGASVTLVSIPDLSDAHVLDGYVAIVDQNKWDLVNSSFGLCELYYTAPYNDGIDTTGVLRVYQQVFEQGNAQGITFVAASGDSDGLGCLNLNYFNDAPGAKFIAGVEWPADDPDVTAVGGGNLATSKPPSPQPNPPILTSKYQFEQAIGDEEVPQDPYGVGEDVKNGYWGAGGGRSVIFPQPAYQNFVSNGGGRIVPDVGMQVGGCPLGLAKTPCHVDDSSVVTAFAGGFYGVIGTSVSSPEFLGALALYEELARGRLGNVNTFLWTKGAVQQILGGPQAAAPAEFFHQKIPGLDGVPAYNSNWAQGFTYMDGNGTPNVRTLFGMMNYAPAGNPQTPSNP